MAYGSPLEAWFGESPGLHCVNSFATNVAPSWGSSHLFAWTLPQRNCYNKKRKKDAGTESCILMCFRFVHCI